MKKPFLFLPIVCLGLILLTGCTSNNPSNPNSVTATPTPFPTPGLQGLISGHLLSPTGIGNAGIVDANSAALTVGCPSTTAPALSPDKQKIIYYDFFNKTIDVADVACSAVTHVLTVSNWYIFGFTWSPDSTQVAFCADAGVTLNCGGYAVDDYDLYVLTLSTAAITDVTNTNTACGTREYDPAWSSTGLLGFSADSTGGIALFTMAPNGTGRTLISSSGASPNFKPAWSPDGTKIALQYGSQIRIVTSSGSPVTALTVTNGITNPVLSCDLGWSPDGQYIGFSGIPSSASGPASNCSQIFAVNVSTGAIKQVSNVPYGTWPGGIILTGWQ